MYLRQYKIYLGTWVPQTIQYVPRYLGTSGNTKHTWVPGYLRQYKIYLGTWVPKAIQDTPGYLGTSDKTTHTWVPGYLRQYQIYLDTLVPQTTQDIPWYSLSEAVDTSWPGAGCRRCSGPGGMEEVIRSETLSR